VHNFLRVALGPTYAGGENTIQLVQGSRDNFYGGFIAAPVRCVASTASTHLRQFFDALRTTGDAVHIPSPLAVLRCISVEPPTYTEHPLRSYDVTLGDKMVTLSRASTRPATVRSLRQTHAPAQRLCAPQPAARDWNRPTPLADCPPGANPLGRVPCLPGGGPPASRCCRCRPTGVDSCRICVWPSTESHFSLGI
jgi:hypothetical protein